MEFKGTSGKKIVINAAPFMDAMALKNAISSRISSSTVSLDFDISKGADQQDVDIAEIVKLAAGLDSDPVVNEALMKCLSRCTRDGEKITTETFEPEDAREDYYEIIFACIKVNLSPFFKALLLKFTPLVANLGSLLEENGQKPE